MTFTLDRFSAYFGGSFGDVTTTTAPDYGSLYSSMYDVVAQYNSWADDGFVRSINFRFTHLPTKQERIFRYSFNEATRKFHLSN